MKDMNRMRLLRCLIFSVILLGVCCVADQAMAMNFMDDLDDLNLIGWSDCPWYINNGSYFGMYWQQLDPWNDYGYVYRSLGETAVEGLAYTIEASLAGRLYDDTVLDLGQTYTMTSRAAIAAVPAGVDLTSVDIAPYILDGPELIKYFQRGDSTSGSTEGDGLWDPETIMSEVVVATSGDAGKDLYVVLIGSVSPQPNDSGMQNGIGYVEITSDAVVYLRGDVNEDLYVNINDVIDMALNWLSCNDFGNPDCYP